MSPLNQMLPLTQQAIGFSKIQLARVVNVDTNNYTIDVELAEGGHIKDLQISTDFFNTKEGSGIYGHPDIDSLCLVAHLNNDEHVVLGFIAAIDQKRDTADNLIVGDTGFRSNRPLLKAGDVGIFGSQNARVVVESSNIVHIQGSYLSQLYFLPDPANMIKMITDNLVCDIGFNKIAIENNRALNETNFTFKIRPDANSESDTEYDVELKIGKNGNVFSLSVGGKQVIHIDKNRTVTVNNNLMVRP